MEGLRTPDGPLDVGNSGTTIRLLAGILAGSRVAARLTGDDSIRRRPMLRVVEPLRAMGAQIEGAEAGKYPPLDIRGTQLVGVDHEIPMASAQVKSALLFAGLSATGETSVAEPSRSRDHTERMLQYLGVPIVESFNRLIVKSIYLQNAPLEVPGDLSSAAFLLVAAAILPGSTVRVEGVGLNPTRTGILDILRAFGAAVTVEEWGDRCGEPVGAVTVSARDRRPVQVSGELAVRAIDELPLVAVLGAVAEGGVTAVRDASELRVKESDRVATVVGMLRGMGVRAEALPDGFAVRGPARLRGSSVDPSGDHRIAMAAAVAGLAADGPTVISGWDCVAVSYPGFERDLDALAVR